MRKAGSHVTFQRIFGKRCLSHLKKVCIPHIIELNGDSRRIMYTYMYMYKELSIFTYGTWLGDHRNGYVLTQALTVDLHTVVQF